MAAIASLAVQLTATTGKFAQGMQSGIRSLTGFSLQASIATVAISGMDRAFGALVGGVTIGAAVRKFKSLADEMDRMLDRSRSLGIATEDIAAIDLAAGMEGFDAEAGTKAIARFAAEVRRAADGQTAFSDTLTDLGLNAKDLTLMPIIEQIATFGDAAAKVSQQRQLTAFMDAFGSRGLEFARIIREGGASLREFRDLAIAFGTALPENVLKRVDEMNDQLTLMGFAAKGAGFAFVAELARPIANASKEITGTTDRLIAMREAAESVARFFAKAGFVIRYAFNRVAQGIALAIGGILTGSAKVLEVWTKYVPTGFGPFIKDLKAEAKIWMDTSQQFENDFVKGKGFLGGLERIDKSFEDARKSVQETSSGVVDDATEEAISQLQSAADKIRAAVQTPLEKFEQDITEARDLFSKGFIDQETLERFTNEKLGDLSEAAGTKPGGAASPQLGEFASGRLGLMAPSFTSGVTPGERQLITLTQQQIQEQRRANALLAGFNVGLA